MNGQADRVVLAVTGMSCQGCQRAVEAALKGVPGVARASVDLPQGRAVVEGSGLNPGELSEAVRDAGYEARPIEAGAV